MDPSRRRLGGAVLAAALLFGGPTLSAGGDLPVVEKVEPPDWWVGHSLNPVRVLIRGRHLAGARVEPRSAGIAAGPARVSESGHWLLVDLTVSEGARPGPRTLALKTAAGATELRFDLLEPLPRAGRFQGVGPDDVIYLIMPDRFADGDRTNDDPPKSRGLLDRSKPRYYHGGDLEGVIEHLPYLKRLGVTAIWLNPVYDNDDRLNQKERYHGAAITDYHGYGAVDFYAVDEHLGSLAGFRKLVDEAHGLGIKVVEDQVANHTGPLHPWAIDPPTPTWFHGSEARHLANTWQIWTLTDPYATAALQRETLDGWFIDILPDLDQDDPEVARYLIQNSLWWVGKTGLDAIRQDTLPYVPRRFWRDWTAALAREYPDLDVIGEVSDGDPSRVAFFQGGRVGFDGIDTGVGSLFDYPLYYPLRRAFASGGSLREVAEMRARDRLYPEPDRLVTFLGLHDVGRFMSEPGATATGLKLAFGFLATSRGIPLVYYGDEIAMRGGPDPDNRRDFPGGWPEDARNAFEVSGRSAEEEAVHAHLQRLLGLRRQLAPLRRGRTLDLRVDDQAWAFARVAGGETVLVALNNGAGALTLDLPVAGTTLADGTRLEDRLGGGDAPLVAGGAVRLRLGGRAAAVYVRAGGQDRPAH